MAKEGKKKLTRKQARFVQEYAKDHNGARAARAAGYSDKSARNIASENRAKPYVERAIEEHEAKLEKKAVADAEEIRATATQFVRDLDISPRDRLRAMELLAKLIGALDNRLTVDGGLTVNIVGGDDIAD